MPIGDIIKGAVGVGSSLLGASSNKKAIKKATAAQADATAQNTALQRDIYAQNQSALAPFMQRGNAAGNTINALLGLGGSTAQAAPQPQPNAFAQFQGTGQTYGFEGLDGPQGRAFNPNEPGGIFSNQSIGWDGNPNPPGAMSLNSPQPTTANISPQQAATDAYNIFKQSTGYQDRLNEGYRATNAGYAGRGLVQSGAAQKALLKYGQQQASGEFGNYLGYLGNQQGVGLSGASALAGVGQSYANNIGALNQNQANFAGQAAVAGANNSNSLISGIGGALGGVLGSFGSGSSYGGTQYGPASGILYNPKTQF